MQKNLLMGVGFALTLTLAGCGAEADGPTGLTIQDPLPLSQELPSLISISFNEGIELYCYGTEEDADATAFTCDWDSIDSSAVRTLTLPEDSEYRFNYLQKGNRIIPCIYFNENEDDGWLSCDFGNVKL